MTRKAIRQYPFVCRAYSLYKWKRFLLQALCVSMAFMWVVVLNGCAGKRKGMPKPYGNARLEYPDSAYRTFALTGYPCRFDYPGFFTVTEKPSGKPGVRWADLNWSDYGVTLFTTYSSPMESIPVDNQVKMMERLLLEKVPPYATINTIPVTHPDASLMAYVFEVDGTTSIPLEFMITDGRHRLFKGIVQFDRELDRDSLADIVNGLTADVYRLISSFSFVSQP